MYHKVQLLLNLILYGNVIAMRIFDPFGFLMTWLRDNVNKL